MATQAPDTVDLELDSFPQFSKFPLEIQRQVWEYAVPLFHNQFIPLFLGDDRGSSDEPALPWRHVYLNSYSAPSLLHTCQEARRMALKFYTAPGLKIDTDGYNEVSTARNFVETDCIHQERTGRIGQKIWWKPESDVVVFEYGKARNLCHRDARCNEGFYIWDWALDVRVRYMAMSKEAFEAEPGYNLFMVPGLEVIFILADRAKETARRRDGYCDLRWSVWKRARQCELTRSVRDDRSIIGLPRSWHGLEPTNKPQRLVNVAIVDSMDEIPDLIALHSEERLRTDLDWICGT